MPKLRIKHMKMKDEPQIHIGIVRNENGSISKIYDIRINDSIDMKYQQDINNMIVSMPRIHDLSSIDKVNLYLMQIQLQLKEWQESLRSRDITY